MSRNLPPSQLDLVRTISRLTEVYMERFPEVRFQVHGTLVGVAYHYDGDFISDKPQSTTPYARAIPPLFDSEVELQKPKNQVPSSISPFAHFNQLFLLNRDYFDQRVIELLKEGDFPDISRAEDYITDKKILRDAAKDYKEAIDRRAIHESVDFIDFLLSYSVERSLIKRENGSYRHLLGRLFFRFGEDDFENRLFSYLNCPELDIAAETHLKRSAEHQAANLSEDLSELAKRLSPQKSYLPQESPKAEKDYRVKIPGLHRVRVPGGDGTVDWARFARERRDYQSSIACFGPEQILQSRVRNFLINKALEMLKRGSSEREVETGLNSLVENSPTGQEILAEVMDTVRIVNQFDDFETIYHQMPVTIIRDRK